MFNRIHYKRNDYHNISYCSGGTVLRQSLVHLIVQGLNPTVYFYFFTFYFVFNL